MIFLFSALFIFRRGQGRTGYTVTVELHLFALTGTANQLDMQKIGIIGFLFENGLHRDFEVRLLLFTVCTCV
jgi:hypothetical protein